MSKKFISAIVGILGIWFAVGIAALYIGGQLSALPYIDCSGMNPCRDQEYVVYFAGCSLGGIAGALIISSIIQYINKKSVRFRASAIYCIIGGLIWPLVGIVVFIMSIIPLAIIRDIPLLKEYASAIVLTVALGLCGAVIGLIVFQITQERSGVE